MSTQNSPQDYPAEKARQGEIILKTRTQRVIFISSLAGMLLFAIISLFVH